MQEIGAKCSVVNLSPIISATRFIYCYKCCIFTFNPQYFCVRKWYKQTVLLHSFACVYSIFPAPLLIKKKQLLSIIYTWHSVKAHLIRMWGFLSGICFVQILCVSLFMQVLVSGLLSPCYVFGIESKPYFLRSLFSLCLVSRFSCTLGFVLYFWGKKWLRWYGLRCIRSPLLLIWASLY